MDCVRVSDIPTRYEPETKMILKSGSCGVQYQITNHNSDNSFTFMIKHDNSAVHSLAAAIAALAALAMF